MKKKIGFFVVIALALCVVLSLVACNKVEEITKPQNVKYDGNYITWSEVPIASHYLVSIDNGEEQRVNGTSFQYVSNDTFSVTVKAVNDIGEGITSIEFKPLAKIEEINIYSNGDLSWDSVAGASAYLVTNNGQETTVSTNSIANLPSGLNKIKVKPIVAGDDSFYSWWSEEKSFSIYGAPTNVKYDEGILSWTGNAQNYEVLINGQVQQVEGCNVEYNSGNEDFALQIKAIGNHTTTFDSSITETSFSYLDTVTDVVIEDGIAKWSAIDGAEGYIVKFGNVVQSVGTTTNQYDKIPTGQSVDFCVKPYNNSGNYFSSWSAVTTAYILDTPVTNWNAAYSLDDGIAKNNLSWDAINAATGYTVKIVKDGVDVTEVVNDLAHAYAYTDVGEYQVMVKANADVNSASYYDSKYSAPITIVRLSAPQQLSENFVISDADSLTKGFTVNFGAVDGAYSYALHKEGSNDVAKSSTNAFNVAGVVDKSDISGGEFNYVVQSVGGIKKIGDNTKVTLSSLLASSLSFKITVQKTPQNLDISGYTMSWDNIPCGNGFGVAYAGTSMSTSLNEIDLSTLNAGEYAISAYVRGNGSTILASNPSAPLNVTRLSAPIDIRIVSDANGTLTFTSVDNADSYEAFLDGATTAIVEENFNNFNDKIKTTGTVVAVRSKANYWNDDVNKARYYMSSPLSATKQFIRLTAPTFPENAFESAKTLKWNAPDNINNKEYTPTYNVYSDNGVTVLQSGLKTSVYDISSIDGGKTYSFYVRAVGDETKYVDSAVSTVMSTYKLEKPTFSISNGKYVWSGVSNASSYIMQIDGVTVSSEIESVGGGFYQVVPLFKTAGEHIVTLWAVGNRTASTTAVNTIDSNVYSYTQIVKKLANPEMQYRYSATEWTQGGQIIVDITAASPNAKGYNYNVSGTTVFSSELTHERVISSKGKHTVSVTAIGGVFDANDVHYIDSDIVGGDDAYIILLAAPNGQNITINGYGQISWSAVSGATGYEYALSFDDGDFGDVNSTKELNVKVDNVSNYTKITIKIRTVGNGVDSISSEWTTKIVKN